MNECLMNILKSDIYNIKEKRRVFLGTIKELHRKLCGPEKIKAFRVVVVKPEVQMKSIEEKVSIKEKRMTKLQKQEKDISESIIKLKNRFDALKKDSDENFKQDIKENINQDIVEMAEIKTAIELSDHLNEQDDLESYMNKLIEENRKILSVKAQIEVVKTELVPYIKKHRDLEQFVKMSLENDNLKMQMKLRNMKDEESTESYLRMVITSLQRELSRRSESEKEAIRKIHKDYEDILRDRDKELNVCKAKFVELEMRLSASLRISDRLLQVFKDKFPGFDIRRLFM